MAHPQHHSQQRAVPQPLLFSQWDTPSISLKHTPQPSFFPQVVVHRLRQDLAGAQKKLEEYEDLIASLYVVLNNIHSNVCHTCRERISGANSAPSPDAATSTVPFSSPTFGKETDSARPQSPPLPPNSPSLLAALPVEGDPSRRCNMTIASVPSSQPDPTVASGSSSNSAVEAGLSQPSKVTDVHAPFQPSPPVSPEPIETSLVPPAILPEPISPGADIPNRSDWSVTEFNNKIKPALKVQLERSIVHENSVLSVSFSPDGTNLAVGLIGGDGRIFIYDVKTQRKTCVLTDCYEKVKSGIESLRFSPEGKYLATGNGNGRLKLWELVKKRVRNIFIGHDNRITSIDFSPDGRFLVSSSDDKTTRIWCMRDGTSRVLEAGDHASFSTAIRFSPYGQYIATVNYDEMLRIWNFRTRHLVEKWRAHTKPLLAVAFTPDGYGLVSGSRDGALKYWDFSQVGWSDSGMREDGTVEQKKEILEFNGHTDDINSISISPDGRWVVSGSDDQTVCIWDTSDASLQCTLLGHKRYISSVVFSPAGNYLACGSWDNCVTLWKYDSEA